MPRILGSQIEKYFISAWWNIIKYNILQFIRIRDVSPLQANCPEINQPPDNMHISRGLKFICSSGGQVKKYNSFIAIRFQLLKLQLFSHLSRIHTWSEEEWMSSLSPNTNILIQ